MTLPHNTIQPAPYTVWINYGSEGWSPHECATVTDCLDTISQYSGQGYRITRTVTLIAAGVTMPAPPAIPDRAFIDDYGRRWEWCGGTEDTWAWRITAMPEPPAVCGASAVICGIEYVCGREREHTESVHECTDDIGVMQWRDSDSDEGPVVVRAWTHDGSDGWPIGG